MAIYLIDDAVLPGLAVRRVQIDSATDLDDTVVTGEDMETYAELETNRGTLMAAVGSTARTADFSVIKTLGSSSWVDMV